MPDTPEQSGFERTVATAIVPINFDSTEAERTLERLGTSADKVGEKFKTMLDPLLEKVDEFDKKLTETREKHDPLMPAGEAVKNSETGVSMFPLGNSAAMDTNTRMLVIMEDIYNQLRTVNDILPLLVAALQGNAA